mmetsp:Transcript_10976/g.31259  ORF Transcript_10976/g.31259 Transcript_10976/m.31259 type:complete len:343 (-) Transcript_10976:101-1129(-)
MAWRRATLYQGRMLVVPNRECDIYQRLWCVYEMFVASQLGVPVRVAKTLASAGGSGSAGAKCSQAEDSERIRREIFSSGHSFRDIDEAVSGLKMERRLSAFAHFAASAWLLSMCATAYLLGSGAPPPYPRVLAASLAAAGTVIVCLVYGLCRWDQGYISTRVTGVMGALVAALGSALFLADSWIEPVLVSEVLWAFSLTFRVSGIYLCIFAAGSRLYRNCPVYVSIACDSFALWLLHHRLFEGAMHLLVDWLHGRAPSAVPSLPEGLSVLDFSALWEDPYPVAVWFLSDLVTVITLPYMARTFAEAWGVRAFPSRNVPASSRPGMLSVGAWHDSEDSDAYDA